MRWRRRARRTARADAGRPRPPPRRRSRPLPSRAKTSAGFAGHAYSAASRSAGVRTMKVGAKGYVLAKGEGEGIWFLNNLMTVKAGGDNTGNAFTLIESLAPAGFGPPPHVHHAEDEAFYVLEGEATITCGDRTWSATPGSFAFLPRDIPHSFKASE